jgi:hypothetical protein
MFQNNNMTKESVLIDVVAILEADKQRGLKLIEDENLSYQDEYATRFHIMKLEDLIGHFQEQIEAGISAYEQSQGM